MMRLQYVLPVTVLGRHHYRLFADMRYYSARYGKTTTALNTFECDGATGAMDILTRAWIHHDWLTASGINPAMRGIAKWDDGEPCTRWQSSMVLFDCLIDDGYYVRAPFWAVATWIAGWWGALKMGK